MTLEPRPSSVVAVSVPKARLYDEFVLFCPERGSTGQVRVQAGGVEGVASCEHAVSLTRAAIASLHNRNGATVLRASGLLVCCWRRLTVASRQPATYTHTVYTR